MAITVGTEGPKLAKVLAKQATILSALNARYPHDTDLSDAIRYAVYIRALNTSLTANVEAAFQALFTATAIT